MDHGGICDLARNRVLDKINDLSNDRMGQGESLEDFLKGDNDVYDDQVFALYESYLLYLHHVVKTTEIPLHL